MRDVSLKKVFINNYSCKFWLIFSILSPAFGILVLLSVSDIIPRFPLTEDMTVLTAGIIMAVCIGITAAGILVIKGTVGRLNRIFNCGELVYAKITDLNAGKHQITVKYEFEFNGEKYKDCHQIARNFNFKKDYVEESVKEIYVLKEENGKLLTALDIYTRHDDAE